MGEFIFYIDSFDLFFSELAFGIQYMIGYFFPLDFYNMFIREGSSGSFTTVSVIPGFTMLFVILLACYLVRLVGRIVKK